MKINKLLSCYMLVLAILGFVTFCQNVQGMEASAQGTGILYVYVDAWNGTEAPKDKHGTYDVNIGLTYYIRVWDITEFDTGTLLTIKIGWKDVTGASRTDFFYDVAVDEDSGIRFVDISWNVPIDAMISTTSTVHYKRYNPSTPDYIARGQMSKVGHMHFIPETTIGTIGPILALITGLGFLAIRRKRTSDSKI